MTCGQNATREEKMHKTWASSRSLQMQELYLGLDSFLTSHKETFFKVQNVLTMPKMEFLHDVGHKDMSRTCCLHL